MQKSHRFINTLQVGEEIYDVYLASQIEEAKTKAGKPYLKAVLSDQTGKIDAKLWDVGAGTLLSDPSALTGTVAVQVKFSVEEYSGQLQARIKAIRAIDDPPASFMTHLLPSAPIDSETMLKRLLALVQDMEDADLRTLVMHILQENRDQLLISPASERVHHEVRGGYLYHVLRMSEAADRLCSVYHVLNRDLLLSGVILHDIGKLREYDCNRFGLVERYSREGNLIGHISIGATYVSEQCTAFDFSEEKRLLLVHLILAHHGTHEWGSPVVPAIPEAIALHQLDKIDADMFIFERELANLAPGTFSAPQYFLERARIYKPE